MPRTEYLRANRSRHIDELLDFLRIPSVSAKSEYQADVRRAAEWLVERMLEAGLQTAELIPTQGHPIVIGEWRGAPGAPTIMVYGHYDVQPPEPLDEWVSPPFEPEIRDGNIFARGSVDDKGQMYLHLKAVEAHLAHGSLPVNVIFVVEGEEEVGSPHLGEFLAQNRERLACDAVLISDSPMLAAGQPSISVGLRGLAYMEIRVQGPLVDLHSGSYGGAIANPANALATIIAQLKDDEGRVLIPGFYDDVTPITDEEREAILNLPFKDSTFRDETGVPALSGEEGYSTLERLWTRPTLDVNGLLSGYTGEGAKTVLPARAMAKVSMRLVPNQDHRDIAAKFIRYVHEIAPTDVTVDVQELHGGPAWYAAPEGDVFKAAERALSAAFGRDAVFTREGGSIPIVQAFEQIFGVPILLIGFGLPGENAHAPNEWMSVENYTVGIDAIARFYDELV